MNLTSVGNRVSPLRVRTLILSALDLFSKGDKDGRFWVQGTEVTGSPIVGQRYGYCSIGAINNVPGFSPEEREAAKVALAKMIDSELYGGMYLEDHDYRPETFEADPYVAEDLIVNVNDDENTTFEQVRSWFSNAAAFLKK